jgi:hypothetical protein
MTITVNDRILPEPEANDPLNHPHMHDALTQGQPVHIHAFDFDVEKAIPSWNKATLCKSRPVRIVLPILCWCILLVLCVIRFLMYYYSLPTSLYA